MNGFFGGILSLCILLWAVAILVDRQVPEEGISVRARLITIFLFPYHVFKFFAMEVVAYVKRWLFMN